MQRPDTTSLALVPALWGESAGSMVPDGSQRSGVEKHPGLVAQCLPPARAATPLSPLAHRTLGSCVFVLLVCSEFLFRKIPGT